VKGVHWPKFDGFRYSERVVRRILFLSRRDAARGPMAAALLREMSAGSVGAHSAGRDPASGLDPLTHAVMGELGISMAAHTPKPTIAVAGVGFDIVIVLCREAWGRSPEWAGSPTVGWFYEDPTRTPTEHGARLKVFRQIRDSLARRIERLLDLPLESSSRTALAEMIREIPP
jgi:protein-tyrosine-phosphatase